MRKRMRKRDVATCLKTDDPSFLFTTPPMTSRPRDNAGLVSLSVKKMLANSKTEVKARSMK